ncbi:MAG: S8 family peptidase [Bacteroidales bacterium]
MWHLKKIQADKAWDITKGDSSVKIAVIDTWVDIEHPDLINKVYPKFDPYDSTLYSSDCGHSPHGTTVASFVAAETDGGGELSAIGFNCMMIFYQAFNGNYIEKAHHASLAMNADVLTSSAGGWTCSSDIDEYEKIAVKEILDNGTVIVMPAGNGDSGVHCKYNGRHRAFKPLSSEYDDRIILVSSTNKDDNHTFIQNGIDKTHSHYDEVDICAPGYETMGAIPTKKYESLHNCISVWPYFGNCIGTSFSSPIVAGVCGLIKSINKDYTPGEIEYFIKSTADVINDCDNYPNGVGSGRINAYKAIQLADNCQPSEIYNTTVWENDTSIVCGFIVKNNATLTLKGKVKVSNKCNIIVEPGGKLILDGTLLTSLDNTMWQGIQVLGR